ncbi:MAK10-like protein [Tanacetum coccineum]
MISLSLFRNLFSSTTIGDVNLICTLRDYSKPSHEGYRNTIELFVRNLCGTFDPNHPVMLQIELLILRLWPEDPNQHLKDFSKLMDSLDLDGENKERKRLRPYDYRTPSFLESLPKVPHHGIDLWLQVQIFYDHVNPVTRRTIDQSAGGKLRDRNAKESWELLEDLALYDNESWNDPRDFAKPVKAISLPQDVPSTSDRRLIELENQVQRLMEAHLASTQPTQVNKITTSREICSGPHDTQYCMKNPEQSIVKYASSRTDEAGGKWMRIGTEQTKEPESNLEDEFQDLHLNLPVLEVLAHTPIYNAKLDKYMKSLELGKNGLGDSKPFDTLADLGSCVNIIPLYLFKKLNIGLLEETDHIFGLADGTKSYPVGIVKDVEVRIGKLKLLNDFYVIDMKKDPKTPLLVGTGFLAIANAVIDEVSIVLGLEETIKFMLNTQEFIYTVDMFRELLHLLVETPKNPFIALVNIETVEAFMNRVGYQGVVDKVSAFYTKNLAQPWQKMFKVFNHCLTTRTSGHDQTKINILQMFHVVINQTNVDYVALLLWDFMNNARQKKEAIQYPRFIKLILADLMKKFLEIPQRIEEDYHYVKDDIPLEIHATDDFKEYEMVFMNVDVPMNQPQPVVSTQGTHMSTSRAYRTPTLTASPQGKKRKKIVGESKPGSHNDNPEHVNDDDDKDAEKVDEEEGGEMGSLETRTEEMQTPITTKHRSHRTILSSDKNITQELTDIVPLPTTTTSNTSHSKQRISSKYSHLPGALRRIFNYLF